VRELVSAKTGDAVISHLTNRTEDMALRWPSEEDLNGAAVALTRLQDTYNLRPGDISQGKLSGMSFGTHLTANDCFELGRQSYNNGDHAHTVQWMNEAIKQWNQESNTAKTVKKSDILEYLAFSYYSQDDLRKALYYTNQLLELEPDHPRAVGNKWYYEEALGDDGVVDDAMNRRRGDDGSEDYEEPELVMEKIEEEPLTAWEREHQSYQKLCRGERQVLESVRSKMYCYYNHGTHDYLKLIPYKVEIVSLDPKVELYYEVLSDTEIDTIKELATPRFKRATVQNYKSGNLETASYRISKTAWLRRDEHQDIDRIYQRVADLSGLSMETSEELQVSNYGIGGHYEPHFDFARREETNAFKDLGTGNRIATWLFYESDVELGGATVFTSAGLTLWPKKGTAAFWYNLHKNGEGDEMTRHAACPVLAGTKWGNHIRNMR